MIKSNAVNMVALFIMILMLQGCGLIKMNYWGFDSFANSNAWHAEDLGSYLDANHPIGSDEQGLIEDFTLNGYKHDISQSCKNRSHCVQTLSVFASCSIFFGGRFGAEISWKSDKNKKIIQIKHRTLSCVLTP